VTQYVEVECFMLFFFWHTNDWAKLYAYVILYIIGPQGTSMCNRGPRVRRIPYKSGHFFMTFCKKNPSIY